MLLNEHVARMEHRIVGARIEASDYPDFRIAEVLYSIDSVVFPDMIPVRASKNIATGDCILPTVLTGAFPNCSSLCRAAMFRRPDGRSERMDFRRSGGWIKFSMEIGLRPMITLTRTATGMAWLSTNL